MKRLLDPNTARTRDEARSLWHDNLAWWVNCRAIERFWSVAGPDLQFARGRRDAMLTALIEGLT